MRCVCFVGISDKLEKKPFDSSTQSGIIVDEIISYLNIDCIKINYVSFAPVDEYGHLRYPTSLELMASFSDFKKKVEEIKPSLIVVCGKMVEKKLRKHNFYQDKILPIYHPSYIWVYKRKELDKYISETVRKINEKLIMMEVNNGS